MSKDMCDHIKKQIEIMETMADRYQELIRIEPKNATFHEKRLIHRNKMIALLRQRLASLIQSSTPKVKKDG